MTEKINKNLIDLTVPVDTDDIIDNLVFDLDYDQVIEFIKKLDKRMENWDFTLELFDYFKEQKEIFDKEGNEDDGIDHFLDNIRL